MKGLQEILDETIKKLPKDVNVYVNDNSNWNVYCSISGYINDDYFDIYFHHHKKSVAKIEIARTTKNPKYFIRMIKKIDKSIEINYTEVTTSIMSDLIKSIEIHCEGEEYVKLEGFDKAIIGVDDKQMRIIYSIHLCLHILQTEEEMNELEAIEFFNFNIRNSYIGEHTPIYSWDLIII